MNIAGTYKLVRYGYQYKKDQKFKPISDWYSGIIEYTADGHMSVIVRFSEKPENFEDVVAYAGSYRVEGNKIVHKVTHSVRPSYEGQILERDFRLEDGGITTEFENTSEFIKYAFWKRLD